MFVFLFEMSTMLFHQLVAEPDIVLLGDGVCETSTKMNELRYLTLTALNGDYVDKILIGRSRFVC